MIEFAKIAWFVVGMMAGVAHVSLLRRATDRPTLVAPVVGVLRMGIVAALLTAAALNGRILVAAVGWAVGFAALLVSFLARPAARMRPPETISID